MTYTFQFLQLLFQFSINPTAELAMPIGIPTKEAKVEMETHTVTAEAKIRNCSKYFEVVQIFSLFLFINSF